MSIPYRVALLQSDSELLRYSFADIRPTLMKLNYEWSYYTSENIGTLIPQIERYDAIVLATNACSDERLTAALVDGADTLAAYLDDPAKGMYLSFQRRFTEPAGGATYPFMPPALQLSAHGRPADERPSEGGIQHSGLDHYLMRHPNQVAIDSLERHAIHNTEVSGYYWGYLGFAPDARYDVLLHDASRGRARPLFAVAGADVPSRVVVSSLALDWQRHDALWENALRYVVEGRRSVAIVQRRGRDSFDLRSLQSSLVSNRIAFTMYEQDALSIERLPAQVHRAVVIDPQWTTAEACRALQAPHALPAGVELGYFFDTSDPDSVVVSVLSRRKPFAQMADLALGWLRARFDDGFWDGSFWTTVDTVETLHAFDQPIAPYAPAIRRAVGSKRKSDGSYDHVFVATLAMLQLDELFGTHASEEGRRSLEWVLDAFPRQSLYNQATAIEVLSRVAPGSLSPEAIERIHAQLVAAEAPTTYLAALRYVRTLLAIGDVDAAHAHARTLVATARPGGRWLNVAATAETVAAVLALEGRTRVDAAVEALIFDGAEYLRLEYSEAEGNWHGGVVPTAKALRAVKALQDRVTFPSDEVAGALGLQDARVPAREAVTALAVRNGELWSRVHDLREQLDARQREQADVVTSLARSRSWALGLTLIGYVLALGLACAVLAATRDLDDVIATIRDWQEFALPLLIIACATLPLLLVAVLARRLGADLGPLQALAQRLPLREKHA